MKTRIIVKNGAQTLLSRQFGVTPRMVYNALHWVSNSKVAQSIREVAVKQYGSLYEEIPAERLNENQLKPIN